MAKECTLSIHKQPLGALPRNRVVRITDHSIITSAIYSGRKASNETNKQDDLCLILFVNPKDILQLFG